VRFVQFCKTSYKWLKARSLAIPKQHSDQHSIFVQLIWCINYL
jgi:hypothetical protein